MKVSEAKVFLAHSHEPSFSPLLDFKVLPKYPFRPRHEWINIPATAKPISGDPTSSSSSASCAPAPMSDEIHSIDSFTSSRT
jgi:hypothetical protein